MPKQVITTEIDIPDGYEFVRIGKARKLDNVIGANGITVWTSEYESQATYIIIRPIWQPPSWMRPGWITCDATRATWTWHERMPVLGCSDATGYLSMSGNVCCVYMNGKPTVGDFTPPPCDDWRQSKRRIGGAE